MRLLADEIARQGLSQTALARHLTFSQSQVSRILSLERVMTVDDLDEMCVALGLDLVDIVTEAQAST